MPANAAGLDVSGSNNPNWRGGSLGKVCAHCGTAYVVKRAQSASRFCSLRCVGASQRGKGTPTKGKVSKVCITCGSAFEVFPAHVQRQRNCSKACSHTDRARKNAGDSNPNWSGGLSRMPYPWNFRDISRAIIERDGGNCQNPDCLGGDERMTAHHVDYDKQNCAGSNLICLCSACNSRANFGRDAWRAIYAPMAAKRDGGGFVGESFE